MFEFKKIDRIVGKEIDLVLNELRPADPSKGYLPSYVFDITPHDTQEKAGLIDIRIGYNPNIHYGGNIGYSVFEEYRGQHYAAKACLLLKELAKHHGMESLIITCDPDNLPSRRTCEYIGAELLEIVELPEWTEMFRMGKKIKCRYRFDL